MDWTEGMRTPASEVPQADTWIDPYDPRVEESAPEQHDQEDDHQYQAEAPAEVMVWRTSVETTPAEKENQSNEKQDQSHLLLLSKWKAQRLPGVNIRQTERAVF